MTREKAEKYIKSEMCNKCSVYLGGGKCSDNCNVIEAIQALSQEPKDEYKRGYDKGFDEGLEYGIKATDNLCNSCTNIVCEFQSGIVRTKCAFYMPPHIEPDNCGNYEDIAKGFQLGLAFGFGEKYDEMDKVIEEIKKVITPEPKTGKWIYVDKAHEHAYCSECDYGNVDLVDGRPHNYCPNCGTKMVEVKE